MQNNLDKKIIAYMLQNKQHTLELSTKASFEYFSQDSQWLYKFISDHFNNPKFKEIPTLNILNEYLRKNYTQETFINNGLALFQELSTAEVNPSEFGWYLDKLKTRFNHQLIQSTLDGAQKLLASGAEESEKAEKVNDLLHKSIISIDAINKKEAYKEGSLKDSARDRVNLYKAVEENPNIARGLLTGLTEFDRTTNGLHGGELVIIGGRSSSGKSIVMQNMAVNAWKGNFNPLDAPPGPDMPGGANVLYFSIEMPKENQERRIDACLAGVPYNCIRDGNLEPDDKAKYFQVLKFQNGYKKTLYIVDMPRGVTAREIELKHLELQEKYNITFDLVAVDYIGIMQPNEPLNSDWEKQGAIAEQLHEYARAYNIPVLTAVQLNRPKEGKDTQSIDRISRSDMIPQNANIILQLGCRGEDEHTRLDLQVTFIKNRDGERTSFILMKNFACMQVKDLVGENFGDDDDDLGI